jgi:hypothetical protein
MENLARYTSDRIVARVTTCEIQLASLEAPFGRVIGKHLEIEAPLTELTFQNKPLGTGYFNIFGGIFARMDFDAPSDKGQEDSLDMVTVSLLCIVREARDQDEKEFVRQHLVVAIQALCMDGLIIERTAEENVYTRVGRFEIEWHESNDVEAVQRLEEWKSSFVMTKVTVM